MGNKKIEFLEKLSNYAVSGGKLPASPKEDVRPLTMDTKLIYYKIRTAMLLEELGKLVEKWRISKGEGARHNKLKDDIMKLTDPKKDKYGILKLMIKYDEQTAGSFNQKMSKLREIIAGIPQPVKRKRQESVVSPVQQTRQLIETEFSRATGTLANPKTPLRAKQILYKYIMKTFRHLLDNPKTTEKDKEKLHEDIKKIFQDLKNEFKQMNIKYYNNN
jgi:hypothetical protein